MIFIDDFVKLNAYFLFDTRIMVIHIKKFGEWVWSMRNTESEYCSNTSKSVTIDTPLKSWARRPYVPILWNNIRLSFRIWNFLWHRISINPPLEKGDFWLFTSDSIFTHWVKCWPLVIYWNYRANPPKGSGGLTAKSSIEVNISMHSEQNYFYQHICSTQKPCKKLNAGNILMRYWVILISYTR